MYGTYHRTLFHDQYTGETVFLFNPKERCDHAVNGLIKCHGKISRYAKFAPLNIDGKFVDGVFEVKKDNMYIDKKENAIHFLGYLVKELTDFQKEKIIEKFGCDILKINMSMENEILEILKRSKNPEKLSKKLLNRISLINGKEKLYETLNQFNVPMDRLEHIIERNITLNEFIKQPYMNCLMNDVSIYIADMIAIKLLNIDPYSPIRVAGFVYDAMFSNKNNGSSCITFSSLCKYINSRLKKSVYPENKFSKSIVFYGITLLQNVLTIKVSKNVVYVYENKIYEQEREAIKHTIRLLQSAHEDITKLSISKIERTFNIRYNSGQRNAFNMLHTSGIKILNGPPGSGKTAVIKGIIEQYHLAFPNRTISLAASTGAAAQVMSNASGRKAQTVNKLLEIRPYDDMKSIKNATNQLKADLVIIDESSMIGLNLYSHLVAAIKSGATLILVGDVDQFQSVDYGNVLLDLINSQRIEIYTLSEIMRQSGTICENAYLINHGKSCLKLDRTFHVIHNENVQEQLKRLLHDVQQSKNNLIISPVKNGEIGVFNLNQKLQKLNHNLGNICLVYAGVTYHVGDKVIMLHTDYETGYMNGDRGVIVGYDTDNENPILYVEYPRKKLCLTQKDFHNMTLAYAITGHKSQGTEEDDIFVILPEEAKHMMTRRFLYTSVTRAKKNVFIYTIKDLCTFAIQNTAEIKRTSLLSEYIKEE